MTPLVRAALLCATAVLPVMRCGHTFGCRVGCGEGRAPLGRSLCPVCLVTPCPCYGCETLSACPTPSCLFTQVRAWLPPPRAPSSCARCSDCCCAPCPAGLGSASWDFLSQGQPRVVKILDNFGGNGAKVKATVPGVKVVGRIYLAQEPASGDPTAAAQAWWNIVSSTILSAQGVECVSLSSSCV